jgi:hypothetical protein
MEMRPARRFKMKSLRLHPGDRQHVNISPSNSQPHAPLSFSINVTLDGCYCNTGRFANADYGRFAWVCDPEGKKVELWEPK